MPRMEKEREGGGGGLDGEGWVSAGAAELRWSQKLRPLIRFVDRPEVFKIMIETLAALLEAAFHGCRPLIAATTYVLL